MHVDKTGGINQNKDNIDFQQTNQQQETSIFGNGFPDKNGNRYVDPFDFDNDEEVIKKLEEAGLMGQLWKESEDKVNALLNRTDIWIVQNNQSVTQIAVMVLKQTKPDYTQDDVKEMSNELIQINSSNLDGTKKGFLVNSQIKLPVAIDTSKEKQSKNPVFDYVWNVQTKRIKDIVSKYNLIEKNNVHSQTYNDALTLSNEFIKQYGYLDSASREHLILAPNFEITSKTNRNLNMVKENTELTSITNKLSSKDINVRKYKAANCDDCEELLEKIYFEKFHDKYELSKLNFYGYTPSGEVDIYRGHVAMFLKSKNGKEGYVIDPWISPKDGAIFTRKAWEEMVKEVYMVKASERVEFYELDSHINKLENEKLFYDSIPILSKEIPQEKLNMINNFTSYVSSEVRKGNTFSSKVMDLFKHYANSEYQEIYEEQKDFYTKRDLIKKEVSPKASLYINIFGEEVFNNLINNKKYSKEIMNLFKNFCSENYHNYLKAMELRKHFDAIQKAFPDKDIKDLTNYYWNFANAVWNGMYEGKEYSEEIMDLYFKCDYCVSNELNKKNAESRISKAKSDYSKFEVSFNKNMSVETLSNYFNNIADNEATLVVFEKHYRQLIKNIDSENYGWGKGKDKKALIMPLVDFVKKSCKHLPKEDIDNFKQTCMKELDAKFYTDEKEILNAFNKILTQANSYYKQNGYFDNTLWLK